MITFIELECPNCGANMKRVKHDMCKCTYCNAYFIIDKEKNEVTPVPPKAAGDSKVVVAVLLLCAAFLLAVIAIIGSMQEETTVQPQPVVQTKKEFTSPYFIEFIDKVFGKTPETITKEEIRTVRAIIFEDHREQNFIKYRLEGEELKRIPIDAETRYRTDDLCFFTGLEELDVDGLQLYKDDIGRMGNLQKLACGNVPSSLAESVYEPAKLKKLALDFDDTSLNGIGAFSNLEELVIDNYHLTDISELAMLGNLKSLSIKANELTEYQEIAQLSGLTELSFEDELAKDLSFIGEMPALTSIELHRTKVMDIDFLEKNTSLKRLLFDYNKEIKDYLVVEKLPKLEELHFACDSNMPMPDLSVLTNLKALEISGSADLSNVAKIPELEKLEIYSGTFDLSPLSGKESLREIHYSSLAGSIRQAETLKTLPNLEVLSLSGVDLMQDMGFIFNMPALRELNLYDSKIGVNNISQLPENETLKVLNINNTKFITNMEVMTSGFITVADYDTLEFADIETMLSAFVGVEEFYAKGQKLNHIDFVSNFPNLKLLDIADNYVNDLSPLDTLSNFEVVFCKDNPITNKSEASYEVIDKYESYLWLK